MRLYISSYSSDCTCFKCQHDIALDWHCSGELIEMERTCLAEFRQSSKFYLQTVTITFNLHLIQHCKDSFLFFQLESTCWTFLLRNWNYISTSTTRINLSSRQAPNELSLLDNQRLVSYLP